MQVGQEPQGFACARPGILTLAVISDPHAYDVMPEKEPLPSFFCTETPTSENPHHPIGNLLDLIDRETLRADIVLSPGDFGNKACAAGIRSAWSMFDQVRDALGASLLLGTVGNHDVDSRHSRQPYDSLRVLKGLSPSFPTGDANVNNHFWSQHFVILDHPKFRFVVLNSSAYHNDGDAVSHGRITEETLASIRKDLEGDGPKDVNVLLCHHHPIQHMELNLGETDFMRGGQLLIDLLGGDRFGPFLIVHGHKHHPRLAYAQGGAASPVVFSAGSVSAYLYPALATHVRNQFYIITLPYDLIPHYGLVGTFRAWDWHFGAGWAPAEGGYSLPATGGFGNRESAPQIAHRINGVVTQHPLAWHTFLAQVPDFEFLLPQDAARVLELLQGRFNIVVAYDANRIPTHIGRRP